MQKKLFHVKFTAEFKFILEREYIKKCMEKFKKSS